MLFTTCTPSGGVQTKNDGTVKTMLQVKAVNGQVKIKRISIGFDGTDSTKAPIEIQLRRQTSAGTMTSNTANQTPVDESTGDAMQATTQHTATVEPSDAAVPLVWCDSLHPQQCRDWFFPDPIIIKSGGYLGLVSKPAAGVQVNMRATIVCEE